MIILAPSPSSVFTTRALHWGTKRLSGRVGQSIKPAVFKSKLVDWGSQAPLLGAGPDMAQCFFSLRTYTISSIRFPSIIDMLIHSLDQRPCEPLFPFGT